MILSDDKLVLVFYLESVRLSIRLQQAQLLFKKPYVS